MDKARKFDLNIEKILEDWEVYHAIRELVANAIDEETLTGCRETEIFEDRTGAWHIRDYGRGLRYEHLTQKEDEEKVRNPKMIGKFGVGLKDALATFDRRGVEVRIKSPHMNMALGKSEKHGFNDIVTLHALIWPPSDRNFLGTEFILKGCAREDVTNAKDLFLRYSGEKPIESTNYGDVLQRRVQTARIYVNGVRVAEEENFLFSYNITSLTALLRKALNRERTNVGRSAYSDRVKTILLCCKSAVVARSLVKDLKNFQIGNTREELRWTDVALYACRLLNSVEKILFVSPEEQLASHDAIDRARADGYEVVIVPQEIRIKIRGLKDVSGSPIRDLVQFRQEWNESFQFKFIGEPEMTPAERCIFALTDAIMGLVSGRPAQVKHVKVSESMRLESHSMNEAVGLWDNSSRSIIVKRDRLRTLESYAGTLLHEIGHVRSESPDLSRTFEEELTSFIGLAAAKSLAPAIKGHVRLKGRRTASARRRGT